MQVKVELLAGENLGEDSSRAPPMVLATHEAAHAVVAAHLGMSVIWVEIDPVNARGEMTPETPWHPGAALAAHQKLLVAQAGSAAQCKLNGVVTNWTFEGTNDRLLGDVLAEQFGLNQNDFAEIEGLIGKPVIWERITNLAEALLVRNRIEIPELAEFLSA